MNRKLASGVWLNGTDMDALATALTGAAVSPDASLEREFERLLADCPMLAFRVAMSVLRNRAEAEDVAQEAMLRAYRNFRSLRDRTKFRGWLVRTSWRLSLDCIRSAGRRERRELAILDTTNNLAPAPHAEEIAASSEFERHVSAALDKLPEKLRVVMVLAAIEGYNMKEVAALLDVPEGTVKSRLFSARKQMAEDLRWLVKNTQTG